MRVALSPFRPSTRKRTSWLAGPFLFFQASFLAVFSWGFFFHARRSLSRSISFSFLPARWIYLYSFSFLVSRYTHLLARPRRWRGLSRRGGLLASSLLAAAAPGGGRSSMHARRTVLCLFRAGVFHGFFTRGFQVCVCVCVGVCVCVWRVSECV